MFDSMIESTERDARSRSRWAYPLSMGVHLLVLAALLGLSILTAKVVEDPSVVMDLVLSAPPPPPPPPPPPAGSSSPKPEIEKPKEIIPEPETIVQPQEIPEVIEVETPAGEETGGVEGGVEGGVIGGVVGGVLGGVEGGVIGGVVGGTGTGPLIAGAEGVTLPEVILSTKIDPTYPEIARTTRMQGRVILQAVVLKDGTVAEVEVLQCRPEGVGFAEAAIEAVKKWRYKPALQGTTPVDVYFTVRVDFSLN